ncbi:hypothetical protein LSUE1_G003876 [Lachnellula suecica]|uniref:Uncharacterized protein n=1 Tax=Lachnellula suecica TaxID=602035 RepID=A0A8T9CFL4_9HELO|nr:hypothetical protein LSUE1_G003876 [Lachnellula suecica]
MLFSMFPSTVQRRIPCLPSIRRSVSMYGLAAGRNPADMELRPSSETRTPNAVYTSAIFWGRSAGTREDEVAEYTFESASSNEDASRPGTGEGRQVGGIELTESSTGIGWNFANQGLNLLSLAAAESSAISKEQRLSNASFARQLYIHAITYLLRGLPADLTTEEQMGIKSALPAGVMEPLRLEGNFEYSSASQAANANHPSLLHRTLASTIIQIFIFVQLVLPYLKYLLQSAYRYDRAHKISEKVLSQSIEIVDIIGKEGLSMAGTIYGMGDGKVGQIITETAAWVVEGVTGGIHEGVGQGMVIMGARKSQSMERR